MAQWELIIDDEAFPESTPEQQPKPSPKRSKRWFWALGFLLLCLVVGSLIFRNRVTAQRAAIQADLTARIFEEENLRLYNDQSAINRLIISDAPESWQISYRRNFPLLVESISQVEITDLTFDGTCALVNVTLSNIPQIRNYCFIEQKWQRAPVTEDHWGAVQAIIVLDSGLQIRVFNEDQAFGEALAQDLDLFFEQLNRWGFEISPSLTTLQISIEPHDLDDVIVAERENRLVLNSPKVLPFNGRDPSEVVTRLALGNFLLDQINPAIENSDLPDVGRVQDALQDVIVTQLLTPNYMPLRQEIWLTEIDGQWASPFFTDLALIENYNVTERAKLTSRLAMNYIFQEKDLDTLGQILQNLPQTTSWDVLLQTLTEQNAIEFEQHLATRILPKQSILIEESLVAPTLPITVTLTEPIIEPQFIKAKYLDQRHPLRLDVAKDILLQTPTKTPLSWDCIIRNERVTVSVDGTWLEANRRIAVDQIILTEVVPPLLPSAPTDTIAYLIDGTRAAPQSLIALANDGTIDYLSAIWPGLQFSPLPQAPDQPLQILFIVTPSNCEDRQWFVLYDPTQGVIQQWLSPPETIRSVWRADQRDIIFSTQSLGETQQMLYQSSKSLFPKPLLELANGRPSYNFFGWNIDNQQLVFSRNWVGDTLINFLDIDTGEALPLLRPRFQPPRGRRLTPDGRWFSYMAGVRDAVGPPDTLMVIDLNNEVEPIRFGIESDTGLTSPRWSNHLGQTRLAVLTGPNTAIHSIEPNRLWLIDFDQPDPTFEIIVQAAQDEKLASPVFCGDGSLLYVVERDGEFHLQQQHPHLRAKTLLTQSRAFYPIACP